MKGQSKRKIIVSLQAILLIASLLNACKPKANPSTITTDTISKAIKQEHASDPLKKEPDIMEEIRADIIEANKVWQTTDTTGIMKMNLQQIMQRILPEVSRYSESDTTEFFYNNVMQARFPSVNAFYIGNDSDSLQKSVLHLQFDFECKDMLAIGKFVDGKKIIAITYTIDNSQIYFWTLENKQWKEIGHKKCIFGIPFGEFYFEELNGKPGLEIITSTWPPNMNGNTWMQCFVYSPNDNKVKYAGDFSTSYTVNLKNGTMTELYEGSSYMSPHKTLYGWHNDKLIELRKIIIAIPGDDNNYSKTMLEYYERKDYNHPLKRVFREVYNDENKKHRMYWDNFFELEKNRTERYGIEH